MFQIENVCDHGKFVFWTKIQECLLKITTSLRKGITTHFIYLNYDALLQSFCLLAVSGFSLEVSESLLFLYICYLNPGHEVLFVLL